MRLTVYGEPDEGEMLQALLNSSPLAFRKIEFCFHPCYDDYIAALRESPPDAVIVTADGAAGMEGVKAAHALSRGVPVAWFSADKGFCAESYRLNCRFFGEKPVTEQLLVTALERCQY